MRKQYKSQSVLGAAVIGLTLVSIIANQATAHQSTQQRPTHPHRTDQIAQHHGPMRGPGHGHMGGWETGSNYSGRYNLNTVETIRGTVISFDSFAPMSGMSQGGQLLVRSGNETVSVHLGPAWYLDNQGFQVAPETNVEVTGSRIDFAGSPTIMAAEVQHGNQTLPLRDINGIPVWGNWTQQGGQWGPCCW